MIEIALDLSALRNAQTDDVSLHSSGNASGKVLQSLHVVHVGYRRKHHLTKRQQQSAVVKVEQPSFSDNTRNSQFGFKLEKI